MKKIIVSYLIFSSSFAYSASVDYVKMCNAPEIANLQRDRVANDSVEAIKYDTCQSAKKIVCLDLTKILLSLYKEIKNSWTSKLNSNKPLAYNSNGSVGDYNYNILDNLKHLTTSQQVVFDLLLAEISSDLRKVNSNSNFETLKQQMTKSNQYFSNARKKHLDLMVLENQFLKMIAHELQVGATITSRFNVLEESPTCKQFSSQNIKIKEFSKKWNVEFGNIQDYVIRAQQKREILMERADEAIRARAFDRYFSIIGDDSDSAKLELLEAVKIIDFSVEFDNWWFELSKKGIAYSLHTKHQQYHTPLMILQSYLEQLDVFEKRLNKLQSNPNNNISNFNTIKQNLNARKQLVNENISYISSRGWKKFLDEQFRLAKARQDNINRYNADCREYVDNFFKIYAPNVTELQFREIENTYLIVSQGCKVVRS